MGESTDRGTDAAAADDRSKFTTTAFGRRRVGGHAWSWRRLGWLAQWPFTFLARRKHRGGRFPKTRG